METKRWVLYYSTVCDGLNMMEATPEIMREHPDKRYWVLIQDFDRVTAERDALQLRLNSVEEENDRLKTELGVIRQSCPDRCEVKGSVAGTAQNYIVELEQALEKRS